LVSTISGTVSGSGTSLVDSGASCHMIGAWDLFESFIEADSNMCVEPGMGTKHVVQRSGIVQFHLESRDVLGVTNVLWVLELMRSVLSISTIEEKGYVVLFRDRKVLFMTRGSILKSIVVLGVRERNLYRLKGQPMQAMANNSRVIKVRE
jgi:hypothetical protein